MEKFIKEILNDIYMLDPELKKHEKKLAKLARELLNSRPDTKFDDNFAAELKSKLMARAATMKNGIKTEKSDTVWLTGLFARNFAYAAAGALVMLLVVLPFLGGKDDGSDKIAEIPGGAGRLALNFGTNITSVNDGAFGRLSTGDSSLNNEEAAPAPGIGSSEGLKPDSATYVVGRGGGGGIAAPQTAAISVSDQAAEKMIMPRPEPVNYEYAYTGDDIDLSADKLPVYKRVKTAAGSQAMAQSLESMDFSLFDISRLKNSELTNLNLNENREFGYSFYLNLADNTLDINQNWQKWPHPEQNCRDQACYDRYRLKPSDVPSEDKLIAVADAFLREYGIDMSEYGQPAVQDQWRRYYGQAEDGSSPWVPEEIAVIYPLKIEGQATHDQSGNPAGIYVSVNIRHNKVSGLHSLRSQTFESSAYEAITDNARIIELAEQGGLYPVYIYDRADMTVTVELGTPETGLMQYWKYDRTAGTNEELYVPALFFPVENTADLDVNFYREYVIVPLITDMLSELRSPIGIPEPMPMPLLRGEAQSPEATIDGPMPYTTEETDMSE